MRKVCLTDNYGVSEHCLEAAKYVNKQKFATGIARLSLLFAFVFLCACAWGQEVNFETGDFSQLNAVGTVVNTSTKPWVVTPSGQPGFQGTYCMMSGNAGVGSSTSEITVTVNYTRAGSIDFRAGCWGEGTSTIWDKCRFYIDDNQMFEYGELQMWDDYSYDVNAGEHTFKWSYTKDGSVNPTGDAFFVDDIIFNMSSCIRINNLQVQDGSITSSSANITWNDDNASSWQVVVSPTALPDPSTGNINNVNTRSYSATGLSSNTIYYVYVRANCGSGNYSLWRQVSFRTGCGTILSYPWTENFDSYSVDNVPACWTKVGAGSALVAATNPKSSPNVLKFSGVTGGNIIALPQFSQNISTLVFSFYTRPESRTTNSCGTFEVGYITNLNDASTFVAVQSYNYSDWTESDWNTNSGYLRKEVTMASAPAGSYFAFNHKATATNWYWFVEDINVASPCSNPTTFAYSASSYSYTIGTNPEFPTLSTTPSDLSPITYSSSDENVATISDAGVITALSPGSTTIKAQFAGDGTYCAASTQYILTVMCQEIAGADFHFANPTVDVLLGGTASNVLTNNTGQAVTYSSSDEDVATVASDGTVTILSNGTTTISATVAPSGTQCGKTVSYVINVGCTTPPALEWPDDVTPVYDDVNDRWIVTYRQGYGIKYIALKQNGSMLPSSTTGTSSNEYVATVSNGIISVNTGHGGEYGAESVVTLGVPVNGDYCSQTIVVVVRVECDVPALDYGDDWDTFDGYTYTYNQSAWSGTGRITSHVIYNGGNNLPAGTELYTNNHSIVSLENDESNGSLIFTINVESAGTAEVSLVIPADGETCLCSTQEFAIEVECTDPVISTAGSYNFTQDEQYSGSDPRYVGLTEFPLDIRYAGGNLPAITRGTSTDTRIAYIQNGQVFVNTAGVGSADITLNIPAYHEFCPAIIKFTVTVKYDCTTQLQVLTGTTTTRDDVPIYTAATGKYSYSESIYLKSDLVAAGMNNGGSYLINSIAYKSSKSMTTNVSIYMGNTSSSSFSGTDWITGLTKVVSGKSVSFINGWTTIELERPYVWDGTSNLAVSVQTTSSNSVSNVYFDTQNLSGRTLYLYKTSSILINNKVPRNDQGSGSSSNYVPKIKLCAVPQYTLTYNEGNCTDAVGDVNLPEPQYGVGRIAISTVRPNCSQGAFIGWSTSSTITSYDDIDSYLMPGDVINIRENTTLYAVFKVCNGVAASSITIPEGEGRVEASMPYYDVCYGRSVHLTASTGITNVHSYRWRINPHNGDDPIAIETTENPCTFTPTDVNGHDVYLYVVRADGCTSTAHARIRVSDGLEPTPANYNIPDPICLGRTESIEVNPAGGGSSIGVAPVPFTIEAQLGKGDVTFIPDGPNCIDESYTSTVTFYDFSEDARVDDAAQAINYLRVNLEHSFIGDVQIKLTCPTGKSAIILEDRGNISSGHHDDETYVWPYAYVVIYGYYLYCYAYSDCSPTYSGVGQNGDANNLTMVIYVVKNGNNYSFTRDSREATLFRTSDVNAYQDAIVNAFNNNGYHWCDYRSGYYLYNDFYGVSLSFSVPPNSLGFGNSSLSDGTGEYICDPSSNASGTGADYCWSENTTNGYTYRTGAVYDYANHTAGPSGGVNYLVVPSNVASKTDFYHPKESFRELAGCPLNGDWTLTVSDAEIYDNGWIFNWEISFSETVIPEPWGYNVELASSNVEGLADFVTLSGSSMPYNINIAPIEPSHAEPRHQSCNLVMTDNLGCHAATIPITYSVDEAFTANITQPGAICVGSSTNLTAHLSETNAYTYVWSKGDTPITPSNVETLTTEPILENSPYTVLVSRADGCKAIAHADINITHPMVGSQTGDFIWTGKSSDWNADYNWFEFDAQEARYNLASSARPGANSNVYVMDYDCVSTPATLSINGTANANNINVTGGITLNGGANSSDALNVSGNMLFETYNGGTADFAPGSGTVNFVGSGDQTITKSDEIDFKNVVFNQGAAGHTITAEHGITVSGAATFTKGIVVGDATFEENSRVTNTIAEMTRASYVDGLVTKKGSETFTFPTGGDGVLGAFSVTLGSNTGDVNVKFNHSTADNGDGTHGFTLAEFPRWWNINDMCSENSPQLDHVSNFEYWEIDGLGTNTALSNLTLKVDADAQTEHFHNPSAYDNTKIKAVAHYNCWKNISDIDGNHASVVVANDNNNHRTITVSGISTIPRSLPRAADGGNFDGIITLGSTDHSTVLPIELTALTATCDGRKALVEWTTASERNNDYFVVERSDDAINFVEVGRVAGAGNSIEPLDYNFTDYGIHEGDNYYRLVQVDYDGTRTVSEIVLAVCAGGVEGEPEVYAYPNPFSGDLTVELDNFGNRPARIDVFDVLGRLVYTEDVDAPQNSYQTLLHLGGLSNSTYTVRVSTSDFILNRKVVKN